MKISVWAAALAFGVGSMVAGPGWSAESGELLRDRQRAAAALKEKNPQRALKVLEPWVKKRPDDIELANDYALALAQMGKLDQAREVIEEAMNKNPQTAAAFANLREILSQQAAISYAKAMGKKPPNAQVTLRGAGPGAEAPVVLAQAEPRPGASVEPPPAKAAPKSAAAESKADTKAAAPQDRSPEPKDQKTVTKSETPAAPGKSADPKSDEAAIAAAVTQWADAWASKDFKRYLAAYSDRFEPQQFGTRAAWEAHRRPRVTKPEPILVKVSEIKVKPLPGGDAEVKFRQRYESGAIKLNSVKTVIFTRDSGSWKILREEGR
jgi:tetratricopeptide (TPR) repeat protein